MEEIIKKAKEIGFTQAKELDIKTLKALDEVRGMCSVDKCRQYNTTWSCPPGCGTIEECQNRMNSYKYGILLQVTGNVEDSFDMEGIEEIKLNINKYLYELSEYVRSLYSDVLVLNAGACTLCEKCTFPNEPCRFPQKANSSMEAYGLWVSDVCTKNDVKYYYGENTMTFTACILFNK